MTLKIEEIKDIRKKLELTQSDLAKRSSVSQSLIAKIEAGNIDPSYSSVTKIIDTLEALSEKKSLKAKDIMQKKIITAEDKISISDAIKKMKKHQISQMPVTKDGTTVGLVSENSILNAFLNKKESLNVKDIMEEVPPMITKDTNIDVVSSLLRFFQIIIVSEKGKPIGLITKADLLEKVYR
jgi:predicted transcriptional regulator